MVAARGLGVTVTKGWIVPRTDKFQLHCLELFSLVANGDRLLHELMELSVKMIKKITRFGFIVVVPQVTKLVQLICETVNCVNKTMRLRLGC